MFKLSILALLAVAAFASSVKDKEEYLYVLFPAKCYDKFFNQLNPFDFECLLKIASKGLSLAIVGLSVTLKLPQMINILKSKSVAGLSFRAMFNELVMYGFNISYNVNMGTDFMLYGENVFIIFQNFILIYLFKKFSKDTTWTKFITHMVIFCLLVLPLLFGLLPKQVFVFSIYINIVLIFVSRVPQIHLNYKNQSTGQLAWMTCFLNLAGSLTRAFTYVVSSSDWLYNIQNFEAFGLNLVIMSQIVMYRKKKLD